MAIQIAGIEPKAFLLNGLGFYQGQISAELAKGAKADRAKITEAFAAGREFAKDAAPYCHSRLGSIEHSGAIGSYDLSRVTDADLNKLEAILGPLADNRSDQGGEGAPGFVPSFKSDTAT